MWQLILASRAGALLGELSDASSRQINFGLSTMNSLSFEVRADHPLGDLLIDGDSLIYLYSKSGSSASVLRMVAEIVTSEEVASDSGASIAVTAAEAGFFRLQHRLIGRSTTGFLSGTAAAPTNRATIAAAVIDEVNAAAASGVQKGSMPTASIGSIAAGPWYYKNAMEALIDLAFAGDGFDFIIDPLDLASTGYVASFRCAYGIGTTQTEAIFEYGTGKRNVLSYKRQVSRDSLLNTAYALPAAFPDNTADTVQSATDAASITARGRWDGVISSDLTTASARLALASQHVLLRKAARQRIEFVPGPSAPVYGIDYSVGDTVTARAEHPANSIRFNAAFRVYGASISIDAEGREQTTLTLISD